MNNSLNNEQKPVLQQHDVISRRLEEGWNGVNVEKGFCPACQTSHYLHTYYNQAGKCVVVDCPSTKKQWVISTACL